MKGKARTDRRKDQVADIRCQQPIDQHETKRFELIDFADIPIISSASSKKFDRKNHRHKIIHEVTELEKLNEDRNHRNMLEKPDRGVCSSENSPITGNKNVIVILAVQRKR